MDLIGPAVGALTGCEKSKVAVDRGNWQKSRSVSICNSLVDVRNACCIPEADPSSTGMSRGWSGLRAGYLRLYVLLALCLQVLATSCFF